MKRLLILAPLALAACGPLASLAPLTGPALDTLRAACALSPQSRAAVVARLGVTEAEAAAICEAADV
jgi:hypothetical protein